MSFFQTLGTGYRLMGRDIRLGWQKHGTQILTGGGILTMLLGGGLMARKGTKAEVQQAIADANALCDKIEHERMELTYNEQGNLTPESKKLVRKRKFVLAKAKAKKLWTVGKHFIPEVLVEVGGAVAIGTAQHINTKQKTALATGLAAVSADFAAYRANVIADQGAEKDQEYLGTKKAKGAKSVTLEDGTVVESPDSEGGDVTVNADPNAFKFWCSPETCPSIYSDNLDMTIANLECVQRDLARMLRMNAMANKNGIGTLYLNDMRREFGGNTPKKMDVPLGGLFGITLDRHNKESCEKYAYEIDLGWSHDEDFMNGRKVGVWIIFPHDDEPIIGKVNQSLLAVEDPVR